MPQRKCTQTSKPNDFAPTALQLWSRYAPAQQSTRRYETVYLIAITGKKNEQDNVQGNTNQGDAQDIDDKKNLPQPSTRYYHA
jgi:hypothetical protein